MKNRLTIVILTLNVREQLETCFQSLSWFREAPFGAKFLIIDSGSHDSTLEYAREIADEVVVRKLTSFSEQRNFALQMIQSEWALFIDSDERITQILQKNLLRLLSEPISPAVSAFAIQRKNVLFGRLMHYGSNGGDWQVRLLRKGKTSYQGRVHEQVCVEGATAKIDGFLLHYSTTDLNTYMGKLIRYTALEGEEIAATRAFNRPRALLSLAVDPPLFFVKEYILKRGFRDGTEGFLFAILSAYNRFLTRAKYIESRWKN